MSSVRMVLMALMSAIIGLALMSAPSVSAETAQQRDTCITDTRAGAGPGDDICVITTEIYNSFSGLEDLNVLMNDVADGEPVPHVIDLEDFSGTEKDQFAYFVTRIATDGMKSFEGYIERGAPEFTLEYTESNDITHTISFVPFDVPDAVPPKVKKAKRPLATCLDPTTQPVKVIKGYIMACEPTRADGGRKVVIYYGKRTAPGPDGHIILRAGVTKLERVHREKIYWMAFDWRSGRFIGEGFVRNIPLPKGDGPHMLTRSTTMPRAATTPWSGPDDIPVGQLWRVLGSR